jgi:hypothetical protein
MLTTRENLLQTLRGGSPDRFVTGWEPFKIILNDPVYAYLRAGRKKGGMSVDRWGTWINWPEDQPAAMPHITEANKVLKDITRWRELQIPDLEANCGTDWSAALDTVAQMNPDEKLSVAFMPTGLFEQSHFLMGFEDTLCNLMLEPDAMLELLEAIFTFKMTHARLLAENLKPDIILSHDDWGEKTRLFMNPEIWREFFKPFYARLYGYIRSQGILVMHHADSFCEPIAEDMAEIGIDIWQGVLPQNDIPKMQKQLGGRMTLMGGIDTAAIDVAGWTEDAVRAETRRACLAYGRTGHYIPSHTYGLFGTLYPEVEGIIHDEINRCSREVFG